MLVLAAHTQLEGDEDAQQRGGARGHAAHLDVRHIDIFKCTAHVVDAVHS